MNLLRFALAFLLASACGQAAPTTALTTNVVSQYLFRGERRGGPAFQPWVEQRRDALTFGIWSSVPLTDKVPGQSDPEIDAYGNYRFKLGDAVGITPGFTAYGYPNAHPAHGGYRGTFEPSLALDYTVGGVRLTPTLYHDFQLDGTTAEINASFAVPVTKFGVELDFDATLGTRTEHDRVHGAEPRVTVRGDYSSVGVTLPFEITAHGRLSAGVAWAKGFDFQWRQPGRPPAADPLIASRLIVTLGYRYTF